MSRVFWLGVTGLIFGILGAVLVVLLESIGLVGATGDTSLSFNAAVAIVFSIVGMIGAILEQRRIPSFGATSGIAPYYNAAGPIVFSIIGIVEAILEHRRILGGLLMIVGAVGVLTSISVFGMPSFFLFLIGGILILAQKKERPVISSR
jgi:hypothetical protein